MHYYDHLERSGHRHLLLENPVRLATGVSGNLIDRNDLVRGIAILIKGLMAGDPIIGNVLNSVDHSLAERLGTSHIARIPRGVSTLGKGCLDRLNQDVCAVIGSGAVDADGTLYLIILANECLCSRVLTRVDHSYGAIDGGRREADR